MNINMPTSLAGGRYQLGQLVGRGGMAEVHVATDTRLGRTVAVKIMRADFATDSIFLERFRREAHSVAQMNNSITFKTVLIAIVIYITVNSLGIHSEVTHTECFKNKTECLQIID